jgi:hypothetical protein
MWHGANAVERATGDQTMPSSGTTSRSLAAIAALAVLCACTGRAPKESATLPDQPRYEHKETQDLVALVTDAAKLVETEGEDAFTALRVPDSRWRLEGS